MVTVDTAKLVEQVSEYKYGFTTNIEQEFAPKGLNEDTVKFISNKKKERLARRYSEYLFRYKKYKKIRLEAKIYY